MKSLFPWLFSCLLSCFTAATVLAAPSGGDYAKAVSTTEVTDRTTSAIRALNTFLCVFSKAIPSGTVNRGQYVALVRMNECVGPDAAGIIQTLSVTSSRSSIDAPQVSKGHFFLTLRDNVPPVTMYFHLEAFQPPSDQLPNGIFTLEMSGQLDGKPALRGRIAATNSGLTMVLNSDYYGQQETIQLALKNTSAGEKRVDGMLKQTVGLNGKFERSSTYRFAEGANYFCRHVVDVDSTGTASPTKVGCFDRRASEALPLFVTYGLYDDTGTRVYPEANGIAIRDEFGRYGYASYRSVFPTSLASGSTVTRTDGTKSYTVFRAPGSLERIIVERTSIDSLDGGFEADLLLPDLTGSTDAQSVYMYWDSQTKQFKLVDWLNCTGTSATDCAVKDFPTGTVLDGSELVKRLGGGTMLSVFSDRNEMLDIDLSVPTAPTVRREIAQAVGPTQAGLTQFVCLSDCPDLDAMKAASDISQVYGKAMVTYDWDASTLSLRDDLARALVADQPSLAGLGVDAITSGPLVRVEDYKRASADCVSATQGQPCTLDEVLTLVSSRYRWSMPLESAQRPAFLKDGSAWVELFPQAEKVGFTVPSSAEELAGVSFKLELDTAAGLAGFPVWCINGIESVGLESLCIQRVVVPDGGFVTREDGSRLWVRQLRRELWLLPVDPALAASDVQLNLADDLLPAVPVISQGSVASDATDPVNPASPKYAGIPPSQAYFQATTPSVEGGKLVGSAAVKLN
mgnify:CR=1 FL=1